MGTFLIRGGGVGAPLTSTAFSQNSFTPGKGGGSGVLYKTPRTEGGRVQPGYGKEAAAPGSCLAVGEGDEGAEDTVVEDSGADEDVRGDPSGAGARGGAGWGNTKRANLNLKKKPVPGGRAE